MDIFSGGTGSSLTLAAAESGRGGSFNMSSGGGVLLVASLISWARSGGRDTPALGSSIVSCFAIFLAAAMSA